MTITDRSQDASALAGDDGAMGPRSDNPRRRTFTAAYKLSTLTEYDNQPDGASRSALLRREGLYSSHIAEWRRAREAGALSGLSRPAPSNKKSRDEVENDRLRREVSRLSTELAKKDAALEIVGKAHALLELLSESAPPTFTPPPGAPHSKNSRR